jgi:MFS transporter, PAT family, beta-lactamase induction signal transducer AmpG
VNRRTKLFWIFILYLTQGFPFVLVVSQFPVYFRKHGLSLTDIGFMALLTLPWSLKIAWAPLVDEFGERKHWVAAMQFVLAVICVVLPTLDPSHPTVALWLLLIAFAFASATADIAIDTYSIEILSKEEVSTWGNAARLYSWKFGAMLATGAVGWIASASGWFMAFAASASFLFCLIPITLLAPSPKLVMAASDRKEQAPLLSKKFWLEGYAALFQRPGILFVLLFVLTYKLGSATIAPMIGPFWSDQGYSAKEIGLVTGTLGTAETFIAPLIAAWLISRIKLFNALWVFGLLQMAPALLYAVVAHFGFGRPVIYAASLAQSFDISLAQFAFTGFMMYVVDKKHAATQYALLSCVFAFTRSSSGWLGSFGAESWGYAPFFVLTFFLGFVAFIFLPWVKRWLAQSGQEAR